MTDAREEHIARLEAHVAALPTFLITPRSSTWCATSSGTSDVRIE